MYKVLLMKKNTIEVIFWKQINNRLYFYYY